MKALPLMLHPSPAQELVARCLPGQPAATDAQARAQLQTWTGSVMRWCRLLCDARVQPDDACQEVLLILAERPPGLSDQADVRRWLWGVTWRVVKSHQRRAWVRRWLPGGIDLDAMPAQVGRTDEDRAVKTVLDGLSMEHRHLLWLAYAEGATRAELCTHLDLAPGTLNRKLAAARQAFDHAARAEGLAPLPTPREVDHD